MKKSMLYIAFASVFLCFCLVAFAAGSNEVNSANTINAENAAELAEAYKELMIFTQSYNVRFDMTLETFAEEYENSDYGSVAAYLDAYCFYIQDPDHSPLKDNPAVQRATQIEDSAPPSEADLVWPGMKADITAPVINGVAVEELNAVHQKICRFIEENDINASISFETFLREFSIWDGDLDSFEKSFYSVFDSGTKGAAPTASGGV